MIADPVSLAQRLIRCRSVTPADDGAQAVLAGMLEPLGFTVTHRPSGEVRNLFARAGNGSPHVCLAGHTDVVPPGPGWRHDPFGAAIHDGRLYGRGACDMKGALAAFAVAAARHRAAGRPGSVSLLITGDEEGPATDGTIRVLEWLAATGGLPDLCLVGEPTSAAMLGDTIKIGRRGSVGATITVPGRQGHVAYPHLADNPIHRLVGALAELTGHVLDHGTTAFEPSCLQVTSIDVGNPAANVIPAQAQARLNIRFNDRHTGAALAAWVAEVVARHCPGAQVEARISGEAFLTGGDLGPRLAGCVARMTGQSPRLETGGGTSDARFIAAYMPVAEFGLVGASMHQADEHVPVADLLMLADIYTAMLQELTS